METIMFILGFTMIYSWIHATVICFKKLKGLTKYEKIVTMAGFVFIFLFIIGTMMN